MTLADRVQALLAQGVNKQAIANQLGITRPKVQRIARKLVPRNEALEALGLADKTMRVSGDTAECEVRVPRFIATEADAIAASEIDVTVWHVAGMEVRHYAMGTKDGPIQASYVKLRLVRKTVENDAARVLDAIVTGLAARVTPLSASKRIVTAPRLLRQRIITDLHIGGYAWSKTTGGESWDIAKARRVAYAANAALDAQVPTDATETCIAILGDICHYDTPKGTTTGGTQLDLDSRADLMLQVASEYLVDTIATEAESRPTTVYMVEGNHDKILSKALRRLLLMMFATHRNVTITECYTPRQYHRWGGVLQGFTHGDANAERSTAAMALEAGDLGLWDGAGCRELHSGHLHHEAEKQRLYTGTTTLGGVVRRTHIALTPVDGYHGDNAWVGSTRGMSDWYYDYRGAYVGNRLTVPHLLGAA